MRSWVNYYAKFNACLQLYKGTSTLVNNETLAITHGKQQQAVSNLQICKINTFYTNTNRSWGLNPVLFIFLQVIKRDRQEAIHRGGGKAEEAAQKGLPGL